MGATYYKINGKWFAEIGVNQKLHGYKKAIEEQKKNGGVIYTMVIYKGQILDEMKGKVL